MEVVAEVSRGDEVVKAANEDEQHQSAQNSDAAALTEGISPLTERERQVLAATDRGADIPEIARTLFLPTGTVRNHLSTAIQKLGARNRSEAARIAESKGWL